ncbi:MAG TPA: SCP2 domain-containing protein [Burkholderiales bacterium]|nr:SCP2 domain-containing protein [Burkholderiales bacterium]
MQLETPLAAALNHVLRTESWARERLAPFAGQTVEVRPAFLPALRLRIEPDGLVAAGDAAADLVVTIKPDAPAAALKNEDSLLRAVEASGNAKLAEAVMALVRHLRWDYEEDLSRVFGDVVAHRMGEGLRALAAWAPDMAQRFSESFAAYATDEAKLVVGRPEHERFAADVSALRDAVERLEARVRRRG